MNTRITDVALILWNADVIELVSLILHNRNLRSKGIEPAPNIETMENFIASCGARVVIFDLDPPYDRSAAVAAHLMSRFSDRSLMMTCADRALALRAAPWLRSHVIFQKPYNVAEIADAVCSMVMYPRQRPLRLAAAKVTHIGSRLRPQCMIARQCKTEGQWT